MSSVIATERYLELREQFEKFTKRSLTEKELRFIHWMIEHDAKLLKQNAALRK